MGRSDPSKELAPHRQLRSLWKSFHPDGLCGAIIGEFLSFHRYKKKSNYLLISRDSNRIAMSVVSIEKQVETYCENVSCRQQFHLFFQLQEVLWDVWELRGLWNQLDRVRMHSWSVASQRKFKFYFLSFPAQKMFCSVPGCKLAYGTMGHFPPHIQNFEIPSKIAMKQKWFEAVPNLKMKPDQEIRVCSLVNYSLQNYV